MIEHVILDKKTKKAFGQCVRRNNKITLTKIQKLSKIYQKLVSILMISRHFYEYGYQNVLPQSTHMSTSDEKHRREPKCTKVMILLARYVQMRLHFSFFAIGFDDGQKLLITN